MNKTWYDLNAVARRYGRKKKRKTRLPPDKKKDPKLGVRGQAEQDAAYTGDIE